MSMTQRDPNTGELIIDFSEPNERRDALKELALYPAGKKFVKEFSGGIDEESLLDLLLEKAAILYPGWNITVPILATTLSQLMLSGDLKMNEDLIPAPIAEPKQPVVDTRPRDVNGRFLTAQQIQEKEFQEFCDSPKTSMAMINQRKRSDLAFGEWYRAQFAAQVRQYQVGDAITPAGQATESIEAGQALRNFVLAYHKEPIDNLRQKGGYVRLDGEMVPVEVFNDLLTKATNAGLL